MVKSSTSSRSKTPRRKSRKRSHSRWSVRRIIGTMVSVIFFMVLWSYLSPSTWRVFKSWTHIDEIIPEHSGYDGIDVSKHQGKINWSKVAEDKNIQFVYIKATEGRTMLDRRYHENINGARKAGLKTGSYHFFTSRRSARDQFENFRKHVDRSKQDLIPMVDVEESGCRNASRTELQKSLAEFMELMKAEYGCYPLLYSQYRFYNEKLAPEFNKYFIFMARYSSSEPKLRGNGKHNIWQYSERGKVSGIKGHVDLDRFVNGTTYNDIKW